MQAQVKDNMRYKGIVDIYYKIGDKIISKNFHNEGTDQLKRAFAMFMCGGEVAKSAQRYLPTKLDLQYHTTSGWATSLYRPAPVTNPNYGKDTQWYVEYNSVIPYSLISSAINENYVYRLSLLCSEIDSDDTSNELAYIEISGEDLTSLKAGVSILISWKLKLLNEGEEE